MPVSSELNLDDAVDPDVDLRVPEQCGELVGQQGSWRS